MMNTLTNSIHTEKISFEDFKQDVLNDYAIAVQSREASLLGRKEVLTGKAKFGIFGDGKEIARSRLVCLRARATRCSERARQGTMIDRKAHV